MRPINSIAIILKAEGGGCFALIAFLYFYYITSFICVLFFMFEKLQNLGQRFGQYNQFEAPSDLLYADVCCKGVVHLLLLIHCQDTPLFHLLPLYIRLTSSGQVFLYL